MFICNYQCDDSRSNVDDCMCTFYIRVTFLQKSADRSKARFSLKLGYSLEDSYGQLRQKFQLRAFYYLVVITIG